MFIAHLKNGRHYVENETDNTWDKVPDVGISSLQLALPFSVRTKAPSGDIVELPPSMVTLSEADRYYFFNEAVAMVMTNESGQIQGSKTGQKVAQVMGAIYDDKGIVVEVRIDMKGNVTHNIFTVKQLESRFINAKTRVGTFDPACLRTGI